MTAEKITQGTEGLNVPNEPIIPFIIGDGIGPDIWKAASRVIDAAVEKAYNGEKRIEWKEVLAGQKAFDTTGEWLPQETLDTIKEYLIAVKGPLTTPIGGGIRSLNVALRQELDLFTCLRPVRWFKGVPSPVKRPQDVDMVIFRENTEDIYSLGNNMTKLLKKKAEMLLMLLKKKLKKKARLSLKILLLTFSYNKF